VRQLNLALKFLLEITALVALGLFGASLATGAAAVVCGIALPVAAAVLWGLLAAPRARRRLPLRLRAPFELGVFTLGALALWRAVSVTSAAVLASFVLANALLLTAFGQWEA
jgi:Protein of unknown function (DUF2568)